MARKFDISLDLVREARAFLSQHLVPSPLIHNAWLSESYGCELYLKLENMQPIGSFKIRGATFRISKLTPEERQCGVIAASAGNHAQGVAWGSKLLGVTAKIVMPRTAPLMKIHNTQALGATVILQGDNYDGAFAHAQTLVAAEGRVYVPAFEDAHVIAGQGTAALELLEQIPEADFVVSSMGGGGLMAGMATVYSALKPSTRLVGVQASGAPSLVRSLRAGSVVPALPVNTFADGIAVGTASETLRDLLTGKLHRTVEVDDETTAAAVLTLLEKAKTVSEGSAAIALGALEQLRDEIRGKKVVLIVSGGNIDLNVLSRIIDRGMIRKGRRLRMNVVISDRPGSLAKLTQLLAQKEANILEVIHDRSKPSTLIDQTEVALTLESKGPEHSREIIEALEKSVLKLELAH
ncbi:MAG: threonine ammonia-lyase [Oligoflexia bacterium]|jgi:threonine dehydratase